MNDLERIHAIVDDLGLPDGQWAAIGSSVMYLNGITAEERGREMGDFDLVLATRLWFDVLMGCHRVYDASRLDVGIQHRLVRWRLFTTDPDDPKRRCDPPYLYADMHGLPVHMFYSWRIRDVGNMDFNDYLRTVVTTDGVPCAPLAQVLWWKSETGREKDVSDIALLRKRFGIGPAVDLADIPADITTGSYFHNNPMDLP